MFKRKKYQKGWVDSERLMKIPGYTFFNFSISTSRMASMEANIVISEAF